MSQSTLLLTCKQCGVEWERKAQTGRIPHRCVECRTPKQDRGRYCAGDCGAWLSRGPSDRAKRKWCSNSCRARVWEQENPEKAAAKRERDRNRRASTRVRKRYIRSCVVCREIFSTNRVDGRFCSHRCKVNDQVRQERESYVPVQYSRECAVCGTAFIARRSIRIYCSEACNGNAQWEKEKALTVHKVYIRNCYSCRTIFSTERSAGRYCSPTCSDREANARRAYVIRAQGYSVEISDLDRIRVYERDRWTCQLCRRATSKIYTPGDPWSPSLDHVVPLSKGGPHTIENSQLAHMICNSIKSDGEFDPEVLADIERRYDPCPV